MNAENIQKLNQLVELVGSRQRAIEKTELNIGSLSAMKKRREERWQSCVSGVWEWASVKTVLTFQRSLLAELEAGQRTDFKKIESLATDWDRVNSLTHCKTGILAIESGFSNRAEIIRKSEGHKPVLKKKKK